MHKSNQRLLRYRNRTLVLKALQQMPRITRAHIAEITNLSLPAASKIVQEFINDKIVISNSKSSSAGGRKCELLEINAHRGDIIGLDIEPEYIRFIMTDFCFNIKHSSKVSHTKRGKELLPFVKKELQRFIYEHCSGRNSLQCIGVGISGCVDESKGGRVCSVFLGLSNVNMRNAISKQFRLPTFVQNNANLEAICEHTIGKSRGEGNIACLMIKKGIGAGIILNGYLYTGSKGVAGEFGRMGELLVDDFSPTNRDALLALLGKTAYIMFNLLDLEHIFICGDTENIEDKIRNIIRSVSRSRSICTVSIGEFGQNGVCLGAAIYARKCLLNEMEFQNDFLLWSNHTKRGIGLNLQTDILSRS